MCEVSGIYPSMIGIQENFAKTATEINTKTQGQLTRLSMMLDVINQDFILPDVKNIAKLAADFKQGVEEIYINQDNNAETIEIDDEVRQAEYKYTYSDRNVLNEKSANADLLAGAIEKFAQILPLNMAEIFIWYFEQKGVENPERFLDTEKLQGVNDSNNSQSVTGAGGSEMENGKLKMENGAENTALAEEQQAVPASETEEVPFIEELVSKVKDFGAN